MIQVPEGRPSSHAHSLGAGHRKRLFPHPRRGYLSRKLFMKSAAVCLGLMIGLVGGLRAARTWARPASLECPQTTSALYARCRSVGLDPQRVYHVRDASIDRPNLHLDLDD